MAKARKYNNFWTRTVDAAKTSIKEVSIALDVDKSTVNSWFCGRYFPSDAKIKDLCDLFGVDFTAGYNAFLEIHKDWAVSLGKEPTEPHRRGRKARKKVAVVPQPVSTPNIVEVASDAFAGIAKYIYGKVTFEEYENLRQNISGTGDPMALLYGKIPFEEYMKLMGIVKGNIV